MANIGYVVEFKAYKEDVGRAIPPDCRVVGYRGGDDGVVIDVLIEGPSLPAWEPGEKVKQVWLVQTLERGSGTTIKIKVQWLHCKGEWFYLESLQRMADRADYVVGIEYVGLSGVGMKVWAKMLGYDVP